MASWTAAEEQFLIEHYPSKGREFCCEALGRTEKQVSQKTYRMGLKRIVRKTHAQYENELFEREIDYFPIEQYIDAKTPIMHECLKEHLWLIRPKDILSGKGCPYCYGKVKKTNQSYSEQLPHGYALIGEYLGSSTPVRHKHLICQHEWLARPSDIIQGTRCPKCATNGVNPTLPAILYFVSFTHEEKIYYKIGITGKEEVYLRFKGDWNKFDMEVLWQINLPYGKMAKVLEKNLLINFKHLKINTGLLISGNTETISEEIECPV